MGIGLSAAAFGVVHGLAARQAGFSLVEGVAMSVFVFAGSAPWFAGRSRLERAARAHVLTDEAFALALPAFRTLGRHDRATYVLAAAIPAVPWMLATTVGLMGGSLLPDPRHWASTSCSGRHGRPRGGTAERPSLGHRRRDRRVRGCRGGPRVPAPGGHPRGRPGGARQRRPAGCPNEHRARRARAADGRGDLSQPGDPAAHAGVGSAPPAARRAPAAHRASILAALAAVNVLAVVDADGTTRSQAGIELVAVLVCIAVVAWRRSLLPGLLLAVALVALALWLGLG